MYKSEDAKIQIQVQSNQVLTVNPIKEENTDGMPIEQVHVHCDNFYS